MAENVNDGFIRVHWVLTIATPSAPTVAELAAGTRLSPEMKVSDLDVGFNEQAYDNSNAESAFMATAVGPHGMSNLEVILDDNDDKVLFDTFQRFDNGFLVVGRHGELAASSRCEVYPAQCHGSKPVTPETNDKVKFRVKWEPTADYILDAVVAA